MDELARRLATSTERIVDQALKLRDRGKPEPANRALVAIRAMRRHMGQLEMQASPQTRTSLQRLRDFLDRQERRLLERGNGTR
ncbi:MAG: hypothetical protein M1343_09075 [Chloroflexi bacterium]|nr:hypothetical protein [Chloroflexota bacterium]MDA8186790.1 hypothetical protein [Dehalococcoidales bacterium]